MNKRLRLAFLIGLVVLVINTIVPFVLAQRVVERQTTANEIAADVDQLNQLLGAYKDAETGQRGFVLSGLREFLEPYIAGRGIVNLLLPEIAQRLTTTHNEATVHTLWQLDQQASTYQREQIAMRAASKLATDEDFLRGKQIMDALRTLIGKQIDDANMKSAAAQASARDLERRTRDISAIIAILDMLLLGASFWFAMRLLRNEQYAAEATEMANQHLLTEGGLRHAAMQKLEIQADKLNKIIDTQTALAQTALNLEGFLPLVVERMLQITPATGAVVEMVEDDELVYVAASGGVAEYVGLRLKRGTSLSGLCIASGTVTISEDAYNDPRVNREAARKIGSAAMVVAPLFRAGIAVGVLKIISSTAHAFSEEDVQTLRLVAGLLGAALGDRLAFETNAALLEERSRALAALSQQQSLLRSITDDIPGLVAAVDNEERFQYWNRHYLEMLGREPALGQTIHEFLGDEHYARVQRHIVKVQTGQSVEYENMLMTMDGARHVQGHFIPQRDAQGTQTGFCIIAWDINALKEREMKWQAKALVDELTGACNRFCFVEMLGQVLQRRRGAAPIAVLYLDIDHFKRINDTWGHATGDSMLKAFADALRRALRASDVLGRMGGDEFCILLDRIGPTENAGRIAEKILAEVSGIHTRNHNLPAVTTSIGIAYIEGPAPKAEDIIALADAALYEAKQGGRNQFAMRRPTTGPAATAAA
ncbi:diguanylate cyclase [Uliginosibacterium sp. H3]|uniref:Diguanylate cyclase n=1 Tax=Uliginosibacterium silvisoli TaxID=3114758 RepID=A0ABU6K0I9_9RHOO|nr:diguanylate cyclase [Uliginosibacterium sp. H3]